MIKKYITIMVVVGVSIFTLSAAETKDTFNIPVIKQQTTEKSLKKMTNVIPKKSSSWSKIKDLFM
jgi:hypothetical protein